MLKLIDPAGTVIAEADDTASSRDAMITHTATQDGEYRITVSDRFRHGGERYAYLLSLRADEPDFEMTAAADALVLATDKPTELPIKILRRGPAANPVGPITIEAIGLPPGVTASAAISDPTGPTATEVKLAFTTEGPAFSGIIRLTGKAIQPQEIKHFVRTPPRLGTTSETIWITVPAKP